MTGSERVIAVVGATATGKSVLAEALAPRLDAEVICADSRQVFAELEIGTGKPSRADRAARPHHLFDALRLGGHASAGWYARAARDACEAVVARGRRPLLVGGSGLYLRALRDGLAATPPHDLVVRDRLRQELESQGPQALHVRLAAVDPASAARLGTRDGQRISRALEVYEATGKPLSWWHARGPRPRSADAWAVIEIVVPTAALRDRIARRTAWMFAHGLVEETRSILAAGLGQALGALHAIGYDEALDLIGGRLERAAAESLVNRRTAQLAKRQRTWFRHQMAAARIEGGHEAPEAVERAALEALGAAGVAFR